MDSETFVLLIAEPDTTHANELATELAGHEVRALLCADGADALLVAGSEHPDAVLAAVRLPSVDGPGLARTITARTGIPVVLGVGDGDGAAAVAALAAGATACVAYPYRMKELLPILRAIRPDSVPAGGPALEHGALRLDPSTLQVHLRGEPIRLPLRELRLLQLLMQHADRVVTRAQIREAVWGGVPGSNTITVHIQRLRQRLGDDQHNPSMILTVRGVGYRLVAPR
ncbi:response regulator transcription factor [Luedemannella helvata]|uniref:Response regulator transcription factor n=1 Tax=Luedemannella helvata TaxID=349315 RepID=A0ABN2JPS9_9ACTN